MMISTLQKHSIAKALFVVFIFTAVMLGVSTLGASPAHAQTTQLFEGGLPGPNMDTFFGDNFGDNFPFGYGGGPRTPTPPDTSGIIERVFTRINLLFDRLFNR